MKFDETKPFFELFFEKLYDYFFRNLVNIFLIVSSSTRAAKSHMQPINRETIGYLIRYHDQTWHILC